MCEHDVVYIHVCICYCLCIESLRLITQYIYMYMYLHTYTFICIPWSYAHLFMYVCVHVYVCMCVCTYLSWHCSHVCANTSTCFHPVRDRAKACAPKENLCPFSWSCMLPMGTRIHTTGTPAHIHACSTTIFLYPWKHLHIHTASCKITGCGSTNLNGIFISLLLGNHGNGCQWLCKPQYITCVQHSEKW